MTTLPPGFLRITGPVREYDHTVGICVINGRGFGGALRYRRNLIRRCQT